MSAQLKNYQQLIVYGASPAYREFLRLAQERRVQKQNDYMQKLIPLERTEKLLNRIGYNQDWFKRVILVGGTYAKGSVTAWLHQGLAQKRRTGAFYSPAVMNVCETIQAAPGEFIRPEILAGLYGRVNQLDAEASHFELLLAVALLYCKEQRCEEVVLEVGCGGAHDATNAVAHQVAVITGVGDDHRPLLGATLLDVAREKAGIIPSDGLLVTAEKNSVHEMLFAECCRERRCRMEVVKLPAGNFAEQNRRLAQRVLQVMGETGDFNDSAPFLPGRYLEIKLAGHFAAGADAHLVIDGAHNADKMAALVDRLYLKGNKGWDTFLAVKEDKNLADIVKALDPITRSYFATQATGELDETTRTTQELGGELLQQVRKPVIMVEDFSETLAAAFDNCKRGQPVLITGSFLIVRKAIIELIKWMEDNGDK